jgi:hypothetical protein
MSTRELHELVRSLVQQHVRVSDEHLIVTKPESFSKANLAHPSLSLSFMSCTTASTPNVIEHDDTLRILSGDETRTTLMIKRIPRRYTLDLLRREIDGVLGGSGLYDLLYLPVGTCLWFLENSLFRFCEDDKSWICLCELHIP